MVDEIDAQVAGCPAPTNLATLSSAVLLQGKSGRHPCQVHRLVGLASTALGRSTAFSFRVVEWGANTGSSAGCAQRRDKGPGAFA